jgi:hypothetical protein
MKWRVCKYGLLRELEWFCKRRHTLSDVMVLKHRNEAVHLLYQVLVALGLFEQTASFEQIAILEEAFLWNWFPILWLRHQEVVEVLPLHDLSLWSLKLEPTVTDIDPDLVLLAWGLDFIGGVRWRHLDRLSKWVLAFQFKQLRVHLDVLRVTEFLRLIRLHYSRKEHDVVHALFGGFRRALLPTERL